jgi:TolB-like protein/DNA-binding winged helix-turn-helix (wHTH) protein
MLRRLFQFGPYELDSAAGELRKHGVKVKLQEQPLQILHKLLENPGEIVTREELQKHIWPADTFVDFDHGLYSAVQRLRDALGDTAETPRYIETLPRRGYRFIGPIKNGNHVEEKTEIAPRETPPLDFEKRTAARRGLRVPALVATAAVLAVLGFVLAFKGKRFLGVATPAIRSIAVLPLQNLSNDPSQEYFADAMTEELITELSRISALNVISRTSVMRYKKTDKPLPQIARELNVDAIVEGSILRSGSRVRITAQLIYAPRDTNLWAQTYDRNLEDTLTLQSEVANAIADEIQVKMTANEKRHLKSPRAVNYKAVVAYLEGRAHVDKVELEAYHKDLQKSAGEELVKALASFDRAIHEDPNYAQGYLGYFEAMNAECLSHPPLISRAKQGLLKALELDDDFVNAHVYMGMFLSRYEWNWPGAEKEFKRALELDPNSEKAHDAYANYLDSMGKETEAENETAVAHALDPTCANSLDGPVSCLKGEEQLAYADSTEITNAGDPCFVHGAVAKSFLETGKYPESIALFEKTMKLCGYPELADALARGYTHHDHKVALRTWVEAMEKESAERPFPTFLMAFIYSQLDDREGAFRWLEKAASERNWCVLYLKADPIWEPIRGDPRFADLVRRVGLPAN